MSSAPTFSNSFLLLQQEGHFIKACLTTGLSELRKAHVQNKGAFYVALLNLSVGLERLMKALFIMDFMTKKNLAVPSTKELKAYGHDLLELYGACVTLSSAENGKVLPVAGLDEISENILSLLSSFAQTTRYHNLDALSTNQPGKDPLAHWNEILLKILAKDASKAKLTKVSASAKAVSDVISPSTITMMQGLDKANLTTEQALALPAMHEEAAKHAILYIVRILSPLRDLMSKVSHKAYFLGCKQAPFPEMQEFLEWVSDDPAYVLRKRSWP
jgi:hypothetical protein